MCPAMLNTEASQGHHESLLVREATAQENKYRIGFPQNVLSVNVTNAVE